MMSGKSAMALTREIPVASGKQLAEQNVATFNSWLAAKTDDDFRQMVHRGALNRVEIAKECGFAKSALDQNPRIKAALKTVEDGLRERGVLPPMVAKDPESDNQTPMVREPGRQRAMLEIERLRRLEQENASLRAENSELKHQLERFTVLSEALATTGRIPR